MDQDRDHLKLLSIFHFVLAGVTALFSCLPVIHLVLGLGMVTGALDHGKAPEPAAVAFGWLFVMLAGTFILVGLAFAICLAFAGRFLSQYQRYNFCFVVACLACLCAPLGTLLGVFTLIVLLRPSVKQLFGVAAAPPAAPAPL